MTGLVRLGVTVLMTAESVQSSAELRLEPHGISFLTDGIILQRYTELGGVMRRVPCVVKCAALRTAVTSISTKSAL
jgi:hypothetical protein